MDLKIISAGAGSGKTFRLTKELVELLSSGKVRASGIIATTFTNKAAAELQERVRIRLLEEGMTQAANELSNALIGTVHGLGVKLLKRFAYEAGVSPEVEIIADEDQQLLFNQSLSMILTPERVEEMERLSTRLGLTKSDFSKLDWRRLLKEVAEVARANDFNESVLEASKKRSFEQFERFLEPTIEREPKIWNDLLSENLEQTISALENNGDTTKTTADGVKALKELKTELRLRGELNWHQWAKIAKLKVGAKSKQDLEDLVLFANSHLSHAAFHADIKSFIFNIFELAKAAMEEFERFKKGRGLIDYNDMESYVRELLRDPTVQAIMTEEVDLLLVDEFQDTSPLQLEIFLKLSQLAKHSIWVGDPKQSIYGFRGADPALMQAIITAQGGIHPENILAHSWRSREDLVYASNAIFTKAFSMLPVDQVALVPKRLKQAMPGFSNALDEPQEMTNGLIHWHFKFDGEGRKPGKEWLNNCIADTLKLNLERGMMILPKGEREYRLAKPGDVAILCRSNSECREMANSLHRVGLRAAISRSGLLSTAEAKLILACLKYLLNKYDSLSVAEILLLAADLRLDEIVESRLIYLATDKEERASIKWGEDKGFIQQLNQLRSKTAELSGSEILTLLLEEMDLRRIIVSWGNVEQRLANVDAIISLGLQYEMACNRLHSAASLGGFLLWVLDLAANETDMQGAAENPLAVNVLTYHKSKGLEYPIVICHSLEQGLRDDVWGLALVPETTEIDLDNPLGNRWVRVWINPYADQSKGTILEERINNSPEKAQKRAAALEEESRLLYVGLTRARDYLVLSTREKQPIWINRVLNNGQEEMPALDASSNESLWEWNGSPLIIDTTETYFPLDFPHSQAEELEWQQLEPRFGRQNFEPNSADGKSMTTFSSEPKLTKLDHAFSPLDLPELPERRQVAMALRSLILSFLSNGIRDLSLDLLQTRLKGFAIDDLIAPAMIQEKAILFLTWLEKHFPFQRAFVSFPLSFSIARKRQSEVLDILLETTDGLIVVELSKTIGDERARIRHFKGQSDRARLVKKLLSGAHPTANVKLISLSLLYGEVFELE